VLESAKLDLLDTKTATKGTLRPTGLEESLIIPLVEEYKKRHPDVCLKVMATGANLKFVEDGIDVALRVGELKDSHNIARTLLEYRHILVASPEYIKINGHPAEPAELMDHELICGTNWHDDAQWKFSKKNEKYILEVNESLSLNHYASIQLAAEKGMGVAELPSINCTQAMKEGRLLPVLSDWRLSVYGTDTLKFSIVFSANRYNSRLIKNFKAFCLEYYMKNNDFKVQNC